MEAVDATDYPFEEDVPLRAITDPSQVWNFVTPSRIYLSRRHRRDKDVYLHLTGGCTWEEEHGLQLVFRQGKKLTRVSPQDGHVTEADAYDIPDEDDPLLAAY